MRETAMEAEQQRETETGSSSESVDIGQMPTGQVDGAMRPGDVSSGFTALLMRQLQQQQQVMQQMLQIITRINDNDETRNSRNGVSNRSDATGNASVHSSVASSFPAHAVNLLIPQIPEFKEMEEENVRLWVQRVDKISGIHR